MTVKQLTRKLQHPPCERIVAVRIEFARRWRYLRSLTRQAPNPLK
jgi:hypothetical protein